MTTYSDESERSAVFPVFYESDDDIDYMDDDSKGGESRMVALARVKRKLPPGASLFDGGAQRSINPDAADARGYLKESAVKLHGANGGTIENKGEATFEMIVGTEKLQGEKGSAHSLIRDASICPSAPSIISAGEQYAKNYKSVHNMDGMFIPSSIGGRPNETYSKIVRLITKHDKSMLLKEGEHWLLTPKVVSLNAAMSVCSRFQQ